MARLYKSFLEFYGRLAIAENINLRGRDVLFFCGIITFVTTAIYSVGYHQADEHYQIIDFARYKLGFVKQSELAWEFKYQMRSAALPAIGYIVFAVCKWIGFFNPYVMTLVLRVISAMLMVWAIRLFILVTEKKISENFRLGYHFSSYFLWFIPYLSCRFSSEIWANGSILFGLYFLLSDDKIRNRALKVGLFLGLSIMFRFQSTVIVFSILFWQIFVSKSVRAHIIKQLLMIAFVFCVGAILDRWLYSNWVFTLYEYIYYNGFQNIASFFGVSPWHEYLKLILLKLYFPFGAILLISLCWLLYMEPKNILVWIVIPFLIVHSFIPHKELRFLFPLFTFVPFILFRFFSIISWGSWNKLIVNQIILICIVLNLMLLFMSSFKGAGNGKQTITSYFLNHKKKPINLIYTPGANPYNPYEAIYSNFYIQKNVTTLPVSSVWNQDLLGLKKKNATNFLCITPNELIGERTNLLLKHYRLKKVQSSLPSYTTWFLKNFDHESYSRLILLYEFEN